MRIRIRTPAPRRVFEHGGYVQLAPSSDLFGDDLAAVPYLEFFGDQARMGVGPAVCAECDHHFDGPRRRSFRGWNGGGENATTPAAASGLNIENIFVSLPICIDNDRVRLKPHLFSVRVRRWSDRCINEQRK